MTDDLKTMALYTGKITKMLSITEQATDTKTNILCFVPVWCDNICDTFLRKVKWFNKEGLKKALKEERPFFQQKN